MVDLRTGLQPREDLAPIPPPVGEIVARARRRQARRRLGIAVSALGAVALFGVAVKTVGGDTGEPDARTGLAAESPDTTVATTAPTSSSSTTEAMEGQDAEATPATTTPTPTTDAGPAVTEPPAPPQTQAPPEDGPVTVIQDTDRGDGVGQVEYSDGWYACTTTCDKAPDGAYQWTRHVGTSLTLRFSGTGVVLFGVKEPWAHVATVSIDGGAPVDVDFFAASATAAPVEVFRSPRLADATHTLVLAMTERRNPASTGGDAITFDRAEVTGA